ncbi:MAG: hypothetical protein C5B50_17525 [Verrucomicrobia bacterium]|nr:MAG: hypothetical protein C5B50_17525 [Verrucomicrobiota bacterium]
MRSRMSSVRSTQEVHECVEAVCWHDCFLLPQPYFFAPPFETRIHVGHRVRSFRRGQLAQNDLEDLVRDMDIDLLLPKL